MEQCGDRTLDLAIGIDQDAPEPRAIMDAAPAAYAQSPHQPASQHYAQYGPQPAAVAAPTQAGNTYTSKLLCSSCS